MESTPTTPRAGEVVQNEGVIASCHVQSALDSFAYANQQNSTFTCTARGNGMKGPFCACQSRRVLQLCACSQKRTARLSFLVATRPLDTTSPPGFVPVFFHASWLKACYFLPTCRPTDACAACCSEDESDSELSIPEGSGPPSLEDLDPDSLEFILQLCQPSELRALSAASKLLQYAIRANTRWVQRDEVSSSCPDKGAL